MEARIADRDIVETAVDASTEDSFRLPAYYQKPFEVLLRDAEKAKVRFASQMARKGGRAKKRDRPQELIDRLAFRNLDITKAELLARLKEYQERRGPIRQP
jgi:hypothetical protein